MASISAMLSAKAAIERRHEVLRLHAVERRHLEWRRPFGQQRVLAPRGLEFCGLRLGRALARLARPLFFAVGVPLLPAIVRILMAATVPADLCRLFAALSRRACLRPGPRDLSSRTAAGRSGTQGRKLNAASRNPGYLLSGSAVGRHGNARSILTAPPRPGDSGTRAHETPRASQRIALEGMGRRSRAFGLRPIDLVIADAGC